jgi:hypothetical protein
MFGPPRIDGNRLDDWITGHGGQDQFDDDREPTDADATPLAGDDADDWSDEDK